MNEFNEKESKLAKFFVEREGEGFLEEIRDVDFLEAGIIDSLDLVGLALFIEKEFGKKIDLTNSETMVAIRRFDTLLTYIGN